MLFSAIVLAIVVLAQVETLVAGRYGRAIEALHAADAGIDAAIAELRAIGDWTSVISGARQSSLVEGPFRGTLVVPGAGPIALCCGPATISGRLLAETRVSPRPRRRSVQWRPFLWKPLDGLAARDPPSRLLVVVWVGNDEEDVAGADIADTNGTVLLRSEAVEPGGERRIIEAVVSRAAPSGSGLYSEDSAAELRRVRVAVLNWREVR
jgi:hypothetical protein